MKKILIGCGCLTVLMISICSGILIYFSIQAQRFVGDMEAAFDGIKELEEKYPFTAPDPPRLASGQLNRYFIAREGLILAIEEHPTYSKFLHADAPPQLGPMETVRAMVGAPFFLAKTVTDNLTGQEMSPTEYLWITQTIGATIIQGAEDRNDPNMRSILETANVELGTFNEILESLEQGNVDSDYENSLDRLRRFRIPETTLLQNIAAVTAHQQKLEQRPRLLLVELVFFGNLQEELRRIRDESESTQNQIGNTEPATAP